MGSTISFIFADIIKRVFDKSVLLNLKIFQVLNSSSILVVFYVCLYFIVNRFSVSDNLLLITIAFSLWRSLPTIYLNGFFNLEEFTNIFV